MWEDLSLASEPWRGGRRAGASVQVVGATFVSLFTRYTGLGWAGLGRAGLGTMNGVSWVYSPRKADTQRALRIASV